MKKNDTYLLIHKYLSGQASAAEREELDQWLAQSPENREIFDEVKLVWDSEDFGGDVPQHDAGGLERLLDRIDRSVAEEKTVQRKLAGKYRIFNIAAVVLLLAIFAALMVLLVNDSTRGPFEVSSGGRKSKIVLPDGSRVQLNENSSLVFRQLLGKREVYLKGEAWFEVREDEGLPFIIYLQDASIRVLGTSFNVNAYKDREVVAVVVTSGSVAFSHGSESIKVLPGEKGILDRQQLRLSKTRNRDPNFDAWKTGKLQFRNTRLDVILKTLENYYHVPFQAKGDRIRSCRFTGTFEDDGPEEVLKVLAYGLNITYQYTDGVYLLAGKGCAQ